MRKPRFPEPALSGHRAFQNPLSGIRGVRNPRFPESALSGVRAFRNPLSGIRVPESALSGIRRVSYPVSEMRRKRMVVDFEDSKVLFKDRPEHWHKLPTTEKGLLLLPLTKAAVEHYEALDPDVANTH